jgi:hypothetical protein
MMTMRRRALFVSLLMLVAPLAAAPRKSPAKPATAPTAEAKLIQNCDAHKFETVVDTTDENNQPHKSKVRLCGVEGQSDADWIRTLRDAVRKLEADKEMPQAKRDQIVAAIKAEIARLNITEAPVPATRQPPQQQSALSRDYSALPPLPAAPQAPASPVPSASVTAPVVETTTPATTGGSPPVVVSAPAAPPVAVPKLSFTCYTPGDLGGDAPCAEFQHDTLLTVRAVASLPAGAALRFVRNGAERAEVDLAPLTSSGSMRIALPREVCAGFAAGRLELEVIVNGSAAQSSGQFALRCN